MITSLKKLVGMSVLAGSVGIVGCASKQEVVEYEKPKEAPKFIEQVDTGPSIIVGSLEDFMVNVGDRVYFDTDRYDLSSKARSVLDTQAAWLNSHHDGMILIEGNCDERGTREYNLALGARRASAVRDYLLSKGVNPTKLETISYGKERPIDAGFSADAWARNRNAHTALVGVNS